MERELHIAYIKDIKSTHPVKFKKKKKNPRENKISEISTLTIINQK